MRTEPEVVPDFPASPAGAQTALEEVSPATAAAPETSPLPDGGSCATTATTPTGTTGEGERHMEVQGTREQARPGGEEADPDSALAAAMT